ncbi:site-specific integrase [Nocardiopsis sp. FR6]|uniref:site-specific integrase n=1 Tax=Nocardiopsis sp. FR6 TaxID=2605986 RepID=UPI003519EA01
MHGDPGGGGFQGLRRGEACGLRWPDVDLTAGTLTVRRQRRQLGWEVDEADTRTEDSEATIALDEATVEALKAHRARQNEERLAWGDTWEGAGHVFAQENGAPLHPATLTDEFLRLTFEAGLPPIRLHGLRHGAATIAPAAGTDMKVVQAMLRHSSVTITSDTYTSVVPEVAKRAAEASASVVPRRRAVGGTPRTPGLPTGSQDPGNEKGRSLPKRNAQVGRGRPPGARTLNPRIKSPRACGRNAPVRGGLFLSVRAAVSPYMSPETTPCHRVSEHRSNSRAFPRFCEARIKSVGDSKWTTVIMLLAGQHLPEVDLEFGDAHAIRAWKRGAPPCVGREFW